MKQIILSTSLALAAVSTTNSFAQECQIPVGTYRYLYSDGHESYFFDGLYTIRIDTSGTKVLQKGDFTVSLNGFTYRRVGDRFHFSNPVASYSSYKNGPITYTSSINAAAIAIAPIGYRHSDEYGSYVKSADGQVIFTPKRRLPDLVITRENCGGKVATLTYDRSTVIANLGAKKVGENLVVDLKSDILFDFNSAEITPKASEILKQLAYLIQQDNRGLVVVRGHTDSVGEDDYNLKLSSKRAEAVAKWLQALAELPVSDFVPQGMGESYPIAPNTNPDGSDNPDGRSKNRRVEVLIQTVKGAELPQATKISEDEPVNQGALVESGASTTLEDTMADSAAKGGKRLPGTYQVNAVTNSGTQVFEDCSAVEIIEGGSVYSEDQDSFTLTGKVAFTTSSGARKMVAGVINLIRE